MPFDSNLILRDGTVDLDNNEAAAVSETANADGAKVLDIRKTGTMGLVAVLVLPDAPTTYGDTLSAVIQASDHVSADFKTIASFPTLYALMRRLRITATTAYVPADIGQTQTGGTTGDTGVLRWYDKALETIGGTGDLLVSMVAADDVFDDVDETITSGGTGVGTMQKAAVADKGLSYGIYVVRFVTNKRYIRYLGAPSAGSNFGDVECLLTNAYDLPTQVQ